MSREPIHRSREVVNGAEARVPLSMAAAREPQYNRKMLLFFRQQTEKAQSLWDAAKATRNCSSLFHSALGKATRLLRKHAHPFSICEFYRVDDVRAAVEEICELLRDILQECEMDSDIETRVHDNDYDADKQHLDMLLSYVLGVDCSGDVDATCLPVWNNTRNRHTSLLNSLKVIKDEELTVTNRKIGGGGEGSVYEADWQDARVAVKKLNTSGCQMDLEDVAEFYAEASIQSSLDHRNVVKLHAITTSGCFIMPIAESDLQKLYRTAEQIAWPVTRALLLQAANGLLHLHERNLVHCDVKSSNFLVFGKELSSCTVKIADFGFTIESRGTRSKTVRKQRGTLEWMAPEVYDDQVLTKASDVFSFGVVMYECVTRKHPYGVAGLDRARVDATVMAKKLSGKEPCSVKPEDCPREMLALMRWCCDRDVKNRPTMEQVFDHLQNLPDDFSPQDDAELAMEGLQSVQYNHRMMGFLKFQLEKASCMEKPQCATPQQVKEFDCQLDRGHKLLACHKEPFDVRYFQRIGDTHRLVEKICRSLKSILQEWECLDTAGLEDMVPGEYVEEDKQYLHNLLNCILKGSCSDVSDVVLRQIEDVQRDHEQRLPFLAIVKEDSLRFGRQIGCGMDAVVHAAEWKDGCATVAVKKQYGHCSIEELTSLVANAAVQMALRHEHIVKVHAVTPSGWPVMELADSNLHKLRHDHFAMGWKGKRNLLLQASVGLLFLHSQSPVLVHSGVKPANFLVFGTQPETCKVKVGDIRQVLQSRGEEDVKITVGRGSATWAAPEIYLGDLLTAASDVFSLGVIMYEIVTEQEPYGTRFGAAADAVAMKKKLVGDEPCKVEGKDCPPALQILMKSCCDPEPRNRPTMETVKIQLEQLSPEWAPEDVSRTCTENRKSSPRGMANFMPHQAANGVMDDGRQSPESIKKLRRKGVVKKDHRKLSLQCHFNLASLLWLMGLLCGAIYNVAVYLCKKSCRLCTQKPIATVTQEAAISLQDLHGVQDLHALVAFARICQDPRPTLNPTSDRYSAVSLSPQAGLPRRAGAGRISMQCASSRPANTDDDAWTPPAQKKCGENDVTSPMWINMPLTLEGEGADVLTRSHSLSSASLEAVGREPTCGVPTCYQSGDQDSWDAAWNLLLCDSSLELESIEIEHQRWCSRYQDDEVQRAAVLRKARSRGPFNGPPPGPSVPTASETHTIDIQVDCQYEKMLAFLEQQLLKAGRLQLPSNASSEDLEEFQAEIRRGRCLFARCKGPLNICQYYSIENFQYGVEEICGKLAERTHEWGMHNAVVIEHRIPPDDVEADRLALHNYLVDIHSRPAAFVNCQLLQRIGGSKRIELLDEDELLLGRKLGESSWTVACEAEWPKRSCVVAVKKPAHDAPLQVTADMVKEAILQASTASKYVTPILGQTPSGWLVTKLAQGDLSTVTQQGAAMDWSTKLFLIRQAAKGLRSLHTHMPPVVHAGLRTSNFLLFGSLSNLEVKISNFIQAFTVDGDPDMDIPRGGGASAFVAPEHYHGKPLTLASDIFSLGVILYEVVSGSWAYKTNGPQEHAHLVFMHKKLCGEEPCEVQDRDCPSEILQLMRRCCALDPQERPSIQEVCRCLDEEVPMDWQPQGHTAPIG